MPDSAASLTLGEIAVRFGCELRGDPGRRVTQVATLAGGPQDLGYCANPALRGELGNARLGAVILAPALVENCPDTTGALIHNNPHAIFARVAAVLHPSPPVRSGIHPSAVVHEAASVAASAEIGPFAVVGSDVVVGERCRVGAHTVLGDGVTLGADTQLAAGVTVLQHCQIGARCVVHAGAVIGSDGFGNARDGSEWVKVPQLGAVRIGDDVEVGANTTIDRGAIRQHDGCLRPGLR